MIIHIPHASRKLNGHVELTNEQENLDFLTDDYVVDLFHKEYMGAYIEFDLSRFVCDVERFRENDTMEKKGQGVIYTLDVFGNSIKRNISDEDVYKLYDEHHLKLRKQVNFSSCYFDNVIIVDAHSFTPVNDDDPDICIGTDDFHTPGFVVDEMRKHFSANGLSVSINHPFSGTIVPKQHYRKNKNVISVMIEVNKKTCAKDFKKMKDNIYGVLDILNEYQYIDLTNIEGI